MRYISFILSLLTALQTVTASDISQNEEKKNSLRYRLEISEETPEKVLLFLEYANLFFTENPDSVKYYHLKAKSLTIKINDKNGEVAWANEQTKLDDMTVDETEKFLLQYVDTCLKYNLEKGLVITRGNLGNIYWSKGDLISSLDCYLYAADFFDKNTDLPNLARAYNNISHLYNLLESEKAKLYAEKTLEIAQQLNDSTGLIYISANINLIQTLLRKKEYEEAENSLQHLLQITRNSNNTHYELSVLLLLVDVEVNVKKFPEARKYLEQIEKISQQNGREEVYDYETKKKMANLLFELEEYAKSEDFVNEVILYAENKNIVFDLVNHYKLMSHIKEKVGDFKSALYFSKKYQDMANSLTGSEIKMNFDELEARYQSEKKERILAEQELTIAQKDLEIRKKNRVFIVSVILLGALIIITFLLLAYYRQKLVIREKDLLAMEQQQKVVVLQSRMEGQQKERERISKEMHDDIGSVITTILYQTDSLKQRLTNEQHIQPVDNLYQAAGELADRISDIIWSINPENNSLENLLLYIRSASAEMISKAEISFNFPIPDFIPDVYLDGDTRSDIYLTVREGVNNCIRHSKTQHINILVGIEENMLQILIEDKGVGSENNYERRFGNGIKNMKERIERRNGTFKIWYDSGTKVLLRVPFENKK